MATTRIVSLGVQWNNNNILATIIIIPTAVLVHGIYFICSIYHNASFYIGTSTSLMERNKRVLAGVPFYFTGLPNYVIVKQLFDRFLFLQAAVEKPTKF